VLRIAVVFVLLVLPAIAHAQKRVALVIGNSAYKHAGELTNPNNDAADMAAALRKFSFQVIDGFDLDKASFDRKVREFGSALENAETGVFFYAGHGLQVAGQNYLVPVDAKAETADALDFEMVRLELVQRIMERTTTTNILFLDACRNNPLARNLARAMGTRSTEIGRGLAPVESGVGTLISFSTQPGNVALDGAGRNSPFAGALVRHMANSGDSLGDLLIAVRNDVRKETENKQVPWEHSSLTRRFYFNQAFQFHDSGATAPTSAPHSNDAAEAWAAAKDTKSIAVLEDFIARYKETFYAGLARARIEELRRETTASVDTGTKAPPVQRGTRETVRGTLYRTLLEHLSHRQSSREPDKSVKESYLEAPGPKAMVVCLDWSKTAPTQLDSGAVASSHTLWGNGGCRGLSAEQCGRYSLNRCHERNLCSSEGHKCVLVDVNGRNVLKLNEAWATRFTQ
jgi:uncharacterized caspase-like protein